MDPYDHRKLLDVPIYGLIGGKRSKYTEFVSLEHTSMVKFLLQQETVVALVTFGLCCCPLVMSGGIGFAVVV